MSETTADRPEAWWSLSAKTIYTRNGFFADMFTGIGGEHDKTTVGNLPADAVRLVPETEMARLRAERDRLKAERDKYLVALNAEIDRREGIPF